MSQKRIPLDISEGEANWLRKYGNGKLNEERTGSLGTDCDNETLSYLVRLLIMDAIRSAQIPEARKIEELRSLGHPSSYVES
jgi:hypothetical protein